MIHFDVHVYFVWVILTLIMSRNPGTVLWSEVLFSAPYLRSPMREKLLICILSPSLNPTTTRVDHWFKPRSFTLRIKT